MGWKCLKLVFWRWRRDGRRRCSPAPRHRMPLDFTNEASGSVAVTLWAMYACPYHSRRLHLEGDICLSPPNFRFYYSKLHLPTWRARLGIAHPNHVIGRR